MLVYIGYNLLLLRARFCYSLKVQLTVYDAGNIFQATFGLCHPCVYGGHTAVYAVLQCT